ncbi:unnamed protein product [marine sediment metagenome]|uniref:Restriction system protein Mrr-like N-terminal domain-containing protein n=1 Tax=marine sediment metagenome TaxID=412755 RepID=X1IZV0_9ZZZZ
MPVIRITDATWERLKRWAIPLEDSPEDAVRKVLEAAEEHLKYRQTTGRSHRTETLAPPKGKKLRKGQKTPQQAYRHPILEALNELGGSASVGDVLEVVEKKMKPLLIEVDYQKLPSGVDIRWRNTAMWERFNLVKEGLLKSESPDGIWELSDKGAKEIEKGRSK